MTDYKIIKGKTVQSLAEDLDSSAGEGQIWFNTASSDYKTIVKVAGAWASGNGLQTGRRHNVAAGIQTAGLTAGGYITASSALCEEYDGTSWTESGDLNVARHFAGGTGTQTAGLAAGGSPGEKAN